MKFKIDFNKTPTLPLMVLMTGYMIITLAFLVVAVEYIVFKFTGDSFRFLSVGIFITLVGAYLNGKEGK